jgi:phosphatidylserine/phosphatidylglycerophosphate/cardiolipin synthase-like enzyme
VRLYEEGFLHAKCYLFCNYSPALGWDRFQPVAGIVGSSNFTAPGLTTNKEFNLTHKARLERDEVLDDLQTPPTSMHAPLSREERYDFEERRRLKSSVGARAIAELDEWFERQWAASRESCTMLFSTTSRCWEKSGSGCGTSSPRRMPSSRR